VVLAGGGQGHGVAGVTRARGGRVERQLQPRVLRQRRQGLGEGPRELLPGRRDLRPKVRGIWIVQQHGPPSTPRATTLTPGGCGVRGHVPERTRGDRKSTRLNSRHVKISYAVLCLKK